MFFGVKRERELFLLSEGLVKTSDDDDVFRGMHPKKSLCPKTNKTTGKKAKLLSLLSFFFLSSPLFFSLFSLVSSQQKTSSTFLVALLVFILSARRTSHLSEHSLERTHHRARRHLLSVVLRSFNTIKSVLREKRERRERVVCGYSCVHHFDWRKKHAQVINESTSHLFFSFQKRISSRIPSTTDGGIAKKSRRSRRGVVRARDKNQKEE